MNLGFNRSIIPKLILFYLITYLLEFVLILLGMVTNGELKG